jgi:hypothetical protein
LKAEIGSLENTGMFLLGTVLCFFYKRRIKERNAMHKMNKNARTAQLFEYGT